MLQKPLRDPNVSFAGKNVIVTGANTGLGFEAARKFVALDASLVVLGVRSLDKGERAKLLIEQSTGSKDRIQVWPLDMNSYDSIREFADKASSLDHLDIAVLNAGVFMVEYQRSRYGWEQTFQVNVLSTALLALLLLPKLRASKTDEWCPVLEFVSSRRYQKVQLSDEQKNSPEILKSFNGPDAFKSSQQYQLSKLFITSVMQRLAALTEASKDVTVTAVCPGFCQSDLSRGHKGILADILRAILNALILRTTEEGARSLVSGTTIGEAAHGKLWYDDQAGDLGPLSGDAAKRFNDNIWEEIIGVLKRDYSGLPSI
ncbi:NAD(P)-binding protein [Rhizodiscina lignyota]|uniref:NAD(P)-binding protein n=1 Tax=Rhizodiscina lignyota TaxID=1504668 RepID=A0A9P4IJZ5_9PEZI|nr:NAD(P)-binding protein [Rhizodiscina lignyota]